jgi:hypothetical protein
MKDQSLNGDGSSRSSLMNHVHELRLTKQDRQLRNVQG